MNQYLSYKEIKCKTANELWDKLSPTQTLIEGPSEFIYRGQGNADWKLIPSILRKSIDNPAILSAMLLDVTECTSEQQIIVERAILYGFTDYCDTAGIKLPNDSLRFRETILNPTGNDQYIEKPSLWPDPEIIELMALAQHHRVPTRLLDWTKIPYIAAYFAASIAIREIPLNTGGKELAIWALNIKFLPSYNVKMICVPGAISSYLSAQRGCFTVHPHNGEKGQPFEIIGLEEFFSRLDNTPLIKLTIPIQESIRLFELCEKAGFSGAAMYPSADGAGLAVMDIIFAEKAKKHFNK